jgi:hypothetical protein
LNHVTTTTPIGQAIAAARGDYVHDLCCAVELISNLGHAMSRAANILFDESPDGSVDAFTEAYLRHAANYRDVMAHPGFQSLKTELEEAWFGPRSPGPFLRSLSREDIAGVVADLMLAWRKKNAATYLQMVEQLAIQKVAVMAAAAVPGEEASCIADDYRATGEEMKRFIDPEQVADLEGRFFTGDGTLFPLPDTKGSCQFDAQALPGR